MTIKEAQTIVNSWIEEIVAALPAHHKVLPKPARDAMITQALARRYERAMAEGGRDKEAALMHMAHQNYVEWLATKEPRGLYDAEAVLCLDDNLCVKMAKATKDQVQAWREYMAKDPEAGSNYGNIEYADTRLMLWDDEKNLAELEAELGNS